MWDVNTTDSFTEWLLSQDEPLRESVYEAMGLLEKFGPSLGRPYVDTLNGSDFPNMKELRIQHAGDLWQIWRKGMASYKELLAKESPEMQARVAARVEAASIKIALAQLREELNISQTAMAAAMGVSQPAVNRMEQPENDPRLSTLQRYVKALGGELSLDVTLPGGKRIAFNL
jgi:DNA-binding XRE family transcriptional regulator